MAPAPELRPSAFVGLESIERVLRRMSKHPTTQHNAALVSEAGASRSMDQLRQLLLKRVSFFKVQGVVASSTRARSRVI
jgi:hypothetical protein